jgi:hypothetical protein
MEPMNMKEKLILGCMAALLAVLILGSAGCAQSVDARIQRKVFVSEGYAESQSLAREIHELIDEHQSARLQADLAELEADYNEELLKAQTPEAGAVAALQFSDGMALTVADARAETAYLLRMKGKALALGRGLQKVDEMADRELDVAIRSWNRFQESELPGLIEQGLVDIAAGLEAKEAAKKAEAEARAKEKAEAQAEAQANEKLLAETEARHAAEERAKAAEAKLKEVAPPADAAPATQ